MAIRCSRASVSPLHLNPLVVLQLSGPQLRSLHVAAYRRRTLDAQPEVGGCIFTDPLAEPLDVAERNRLFRRAGPRLAGDHNLILMQFDFSGPQSAILEGDGRRKFGLRHRTSQWFCGLGTIASNKLAISRRATWTYKLEIQAGHPTRTLDLEAYRCRPGVTGIQPPCILFAMPSRASRRGSVPLRAGACPSNTPATPAERLPGGRDRRRDSTRQHPAWRRQHGVGAEVKKNRADAFRHRPRFSNWHVDPIDRTP